MLRFDISKLVKQRGVASTAVFLGKRGFSLSKAHSLAHGSSIRLMRDDTVTKLCKALICTPNDLFEWTGGQTSYLTELNKAVNPFPLNALGGLKQAEIEQMLARAPQLEYAAREVVGGGSLRLNVVRLVKQRQQPYPTTYLVSLGFTRMEARKLLDPQRKLVKLTMLRRLCAAFTCLPNDLYSWDGSETHHLNVLRKQTPPDLKLLLSGLSPEKVKEVLGQLREKG